MGYIEEPNGVDFIVGPSVLTAEAKDAISKAIEQFHKTGKEPVSVNHYVEPSAKEKNRETKSSVKVLNS